MPLNTFKNIGRLLLDAAWHFGVPVTTPEVISIFPHSPEAFTQGLVYRDGLLYESLGLEGQSALQVVEPFSGDVKEKISIPSYFAEGIAELNGQLYQLTWKSKKVMVYDFPSLKKNNEINISKEAWGLTTCGDTLVMSDGSSALHCFDNHFKFLRKCFIHSNYIPVWHLNDLEAVGNWFFSNVWYKSIILQFSICDGKIRSIIDCSCIQKMENAPNEHCIMNGIAFCPERRTFFVTGKYWRNFYEIRFPFISLERELATRN